MRSVMFPIYIYFVYIRLTSFIVKTQVLIIKCIGFGAHVSEQVFIPSYIIPTPVVLYYPAQTGNIIYFMSRVVFRPHLLPRGAVIRCSPILGHEKACATLTT